jgi:arginine-tRNA-protein transferase
MTIEHREPAPLRQLAFYASPPHHCHYLPARQAASLFADPDAEMDCALYSRLLAHGFRRSGVLVYRPSCPGCTSCVPVRIPVRDYNHRRSDLRCLRRNAGLSVRDLPAAYREESFALYRRYLAMRHAGGGMDDPDPARFIEFLSSPWGMTRFHEFRTDGRLLAVAVTDHLDDALSAVYTFFDPDCPRRSLGHYAILWQIETARRLGLQWLYLGYWIQDCRKMAYKARFQPLECYQGNAWRPFDYG